MNAAIHAIKAQIVTALRTDKPRQADRISELESENAALRAGNIALRARTTTLELLLVSSVGVVLAPASTREVAALYVEDVRKALEKRNEVPR